MIRIILWNLFLFALPFIISGLWSRWLNKEHPPEKRIRNIAISAVIGSFLVLSSLIYYRVVSTSSPQGIYVPPKFENGEVVPGHYE